jgi:hypothetical protein
MPDRNELVPTEVSLEDKILNENYEHSSCKSLGGCPAEKRDGGCFGQVMLFLERKKITREKKSSSVNKRATQHQIAGTA